MEVLIRVCPNSSEGVLGLHLCVREEKERHDKERKDAPIGCMRNKTRRHGRTPQANAVPPSRASATMPHAQDVQRQHLKDCCQSLLCVSKRAQEHASNKKQEL